MSQTCNPPVSEARVIDEVFAVLRLGVWGCALSWVQEQLMVMGSPASENVFYLNTNNIFAYISLQLHYLVFRWR